MTDGSGEYVKVSLFSRWFLFSCCSDPHGHSGSDSIRTGETKDSGNVTLHVKKNNNTLKLHRLPGATGCLVKDGE